MHQNLKGFIRESASIAMFALILLGLAGPGLHAQEVSALTGEFNKAAIMPTPEPVRDPRLVAQAMANIDLKSVSFRGNFWIGGRMIKDGGEFWADGQIHLTPNIGITYLEIEINSGGSEVWVDVENGGQPEGAFPTFQFIEVESFGMWLNGYSSTGNNVAYAQTEGENGSLSNPLPAGAPIVLVVKKEWVRHFVAFDPSLYPGVDPSHFMLVCNNNIAYYNSNLSGFEIWVDPTLISHYEIRDRDTNEVYVQDNINPSLPPSYEEPESSVINLTYEEGVEKLEFNVFNDGEHGFINREGSAFSSVINGIPAKTFIVNLGEMNADQAQIFVSEFGGVGGVSAGSEEISVPTTYSVLVQRWRPLGRGEMLTLFDGPVGESISLGREGIVVISVMNMQPNPSKEDSFYIGVSFWNDPSTPDKG